MAIKKRTTSKQKAASRRNLEKARAAKRHGTLQKARFAAKKRGRTGMKENVKSWLNSELQRSMGSNLSDFSRTQRKQLYRIYGRTRPRSIKQAVHKWTLG